MFSRKCVFTKFNRILHLSSMGNSKPWKSILCSKAELRLDITLVNGQSFRWRENKTGEWTGVLAGKVWTLSQSDDQLLYRIEGESQEDVSPKDDLQNKAFLRDYFQLDVDVEKLYKNWCLVDRNFKLKASKFTGVRILRQDPVENLFSFICSSNNNIGRISKMVENLCVNYGENLLEMDGQCFYTFPTIERLAANDVEAKLRDIGFGYRAKFIVETAKYIKKNHSTEWLLGLREKTHEEAKKELMKFPGVGAKVADCVCLMSLDKPGTLPIDTHIWQIATRDYGQAKLSKNKSLTDKLYKEINDYFHGLWGDYAGWAQSVLFSAELKKFQDDREKPSKKKRKLESSKVLEEAVTAKACTSKKRMK